MKREIAINASALEVRVALLEDNELAEFFLERNRQVGLAGNIYKGKVTRVLPGMQAAFVDIGLEKAGFLHVSDFHDGVSALNTVAEVLGEEDVETEPISDNEFGNPETSTADEAADTLTATATAASRGRHADVVVAVEDGGGARRNNARGCRSSSNCGAARTLSCRSPRSRWAPRARA